MENIMSDKISLFQDRIGYHFRDKSLLKCALTHSSFSNEMHWAYNRNNERLEFLGDAVLELVSSEFMFREHPSMTEGEMTKLRASLVCEPSLAVSAREIELSDELFLGKGEKLTGGAKRDSILSDAFEAIIGAIYLDGGFTSAKEFIERYVLSDIENKKLFYDSKTILQEMVQAVTKEVIDYRVMKEEGPDHNKNYVIACFIGDVEYGNGEGKTKKSAEQKAAYQTILQWRKENQ